MVKIRRLRSGWGFESESCNFEGDALFDGEQVESTKGRSDVVTAFIVW